jgi:hypothetical protein
MKKTIPFMALFIFFIFVLSMGIASADLIPSTAPCWVKGTVTGDGVTVNGLTVEAYEGSTLLKSATISGTAYSLNSIGANDGDTITLKVYGHEFDTFTFEGYCMTGDDPWVVEDFSVSKQANGEVCSNAAICTSGICRSGVCASSSGGGGGGGSSFTTSTTVSTTTTSTTTSTIASSGFYILDVLRSFYNGTSGKTAFDLLDMIRSYYGG